ncbi:MAG: hypothetical protein WDZ82_00340 [Candidatus Paceibacterota bacterium]
MSADQNLPEYNARQVINGYEEYPNETSCATFYKRSGFQLVLDKTIDENLVNYLGYVKEHGQTALFNMMPVMNFFSRHNVQDVVFLIRHPLYAYVSWTKPHRHLSVVEPYGGVNSVGGITLFSTLWRGLAEEYLLLKEKELDPILIRYENAEEDAAAIDPGLANIFSSWHGGSSNKNALPSESEELLRSKVEDVFSQLYTTW